MCDPDSAGLSAELHDIITCGFVVTHIWHVPNGLVLA